MISFGAWPFANTKQTNEVRISPIYTARSSAHGSSQLKNTQLYCTCFLRCRFCLFAVVVVVVAVVVVVVDDNRCAFSL